MSGLSAFESDFESGFITPLPRVPLVAPPLRVPRDLRAELKTLCGKCDEVFDNICIHPNQVTLEENLRQASTLKNELICLFDEIKKKYSTCSVLYLDAELTLKMFIIWLNTL
jgi:hypothetical protein